MAIYRQRRNLFEKTEWEWEARPDGLRVCDHQAVETVVPWERVSAVRVAFGPTRYKPWRYLLELKLSGGRKLTVDNVHFKGIADFENRSSTYAHFVRKALDHMKRAIPGVPVRAGAAPLGYWLSVISLIFIFGALAMLLLAVPIDGMPGVAWAKLAIIVVFIPLLASWIVKARPRLASFDAIPDSALPPVVPLDPSLHGA